MSGPPEIVLNGDNEISVDLGPEDQELLGDIELISAHAPPPATKPKPRVRIDPGMEAFTNPSKKSVSFQPPVDEYPDDDFEGSEPPPEFYSDQEPKPSEGYDSIEDEKADLLNKIQRMEKKGLKCSSKVSAYSDIELIRTEFKRMKYHIEADHGVKFARRIMIACVSGIEFLNKKFDPFDLMLDGWSENMMENIDDYDSVFEELHEKYKDKVAVAPEIKLMMMVGGSAMMFHVTKSMFKGMEKNPNMMKGFMENMMKSQPPQTTQTQTPDGKREMRGPGIDLGSLMSGFMPPPMPVSTSRPPPVRDDVSEGSVSDIVSTVSGDIKDVTLRPKRRASSKKNKKEVTI